MTYDLPEMRRDSDRALRTHRSRKRLYRWISHPLFRHAVLAHAIFCLPIRAVMFNRTMPTVMGGLAAGAMATGAFA